MIAKVWQILDEAPAIYERADRFLEATDWVISQMTGQIVRNSCTAGYKAIRRYGINKTDIQARNILRRWTPVEDLTDTKRRGPSPRASAGGLTEKMAEMMGLTPGIAVAVGNVDAHAAVPAVGVVTPGKLVMAMGTSICHMRRYRREAG